MVYNEQTQYTDYGIKGIIKKKQSLIGILTAILHVIYIIMAIILCSKALVIYNAIFAIISLILCKLIRADDRRIMWLFIIPVEVAIHSISASVIYGWDMGFQMYLFTLLPASIYIMSAHSEEKQVVNILIMIGTMSFFSYFQAGYSSSHSVLEPPNYPQEWILSIKIINTILVYAISTAMIALVTSYNYKLQETGELEERRYAQIVSADMLTGLFNKSGMKPYLDEIDGGMRDASNQYIIIGDIDDYRKIVDRYGHDMANTLLKKVAAVFMEHFAKEGYVSRWGADTILVLSTYKDNEKAMLDIDVLRKSLDKIKIQCGSEYITCTMTFGISYYRQDMTVAECIDEAVMKMNVGKDTGKNQICI